MLQPFAKSRLHPYKNLTNHVYLLELFNNLYYYRKIHEQIFPPISCKEYKEHIVYSNQDYEEEFQWPSKQYTLEFQEIKKIKNYLSIIDDFASEMRLNVYIVILFFNLKKKLLVTNVYLQFFRILKLME
jgi:hypothetical protein